MRRGDWNDKNGKLIPVVAGSVVGMVVAEAGVMGWWLHILLRKERNLKLRELSDRHDDNGQALKIIGKEFRRIAKKAKEIK